MNTFIGTHHEETFDGIELATARALALQFLKIDHQFLSRRPVRHILHARPDPLAVGHALARAALSLLAAVADGLAGLGGNEAEGLAGIGQRAAGFVALFEDDGDRSHEALVGVGQIGRLVGEGFLLLPFGDVFEQGGW